MGKVIIIGGGISGLAAAASFAAEGWNTTVFEKNSELRANGNGFPIFQNGATVLRALADEKAFAAAGWRLKKLKIRSSSGDELVEFDTEATTDGGGMVMFKRQALVDLLSTVAREHGARLVGGRTLKSVEDGRLARFEDGAGEEADLIVGADGVFSRVRRSIAPQVTLGDHRKGAVRMLIPYTAADFADSPLREGYEYNDLSGRRVGLYPVSDSELYLLLVFLRGDSAVETLPVKPEEWRKTFPTLSKFFDRIGEGAHLDHYHSVEAPTWHVGQVAIVGDAAHGMTPALGQGANTSLMTGYALGKSVARGDDIETSLRRWDKTMRPMVTFAQRYAEAMTAGRFDPKNDIFFTEPVVQPLLQMDVPGIFS